MEDGTRQHDAGASREKQIEDLKLEAFKILADLAVAKEKGSNDERLVLLPRAKELLSDMRESDISAEDLGLDKEQLEKLKALRQEFEMVGSESGPEVMEEDK